MLIGHPSYGGLLSLRAPEQLQRRQTSNDIAEMMSQYAECTLTTPAMRLRRPTDQRHEDRDQRQRDNHPPRPDQITRRHPPDHPGRDGRSEHELRQIASEVRVQVVKPLRE